MSYLHWFHIYCFFYNSVATPQMCPPHFSCWWVSFQTGIHKIGSCFFWRLDRQFWADFLFYIRLLAYPAKGVLAFSWWRRIDRLAWWSMDGHIPRADGYLGLRWLSRIIHEGFSHGSKEIEDFPTAHKRKTGFVCYYLILSVQIKKEKKIR